MNRRNFVKNAVGIGTFLSLPNLSLYATTAPQSKSEIYSFSKLFQFLDFDELAALYKESGLDGIDLTVRKGGHVEPEDVEKQLHRAVNAAHKHGISVPSIVTDIADVDDPLTMRVLKAASDNGVKYYRLAYYRYDYKLSVSANMEIFSTKMKKLDDLNVKLNIYGGYQNHRGVRFGGSPWEIREAIKEMNLKSIGCFYDVFHGMAEGLQSWVNAMRAVGPFITMRYIKDYNYALDGQELKINVCPLGRGVVDFREYFKICRELQIDAPFCLHIEYPLFTDDEKNMPHIDKYKRALSIMKRDTDNLKNMLSENNIV